MVGNNDIYKYIKEFLDNVIIGTERAVYRSLVISSPSQLTSLKTPYAIGIISNAIMFYFNEGYRALIYSTNGSRKRKEDDDPYYYNILSKITEHKSHSYICLLNILFTLSINLENSLDRSKLDISSLDNYGKSVESQYEIIISTIKNGISGLFNHECNGIDISTCDPKEDLFYAIQKK